MNDLKGCLRQLSVYELFMLKRSVHAALELRSRLRSSALLPFPKARQSDAVRRQAGDGVEDGLSAMLQFSLGALTKRVATCSDRVGEDDCRVPVSNLLGVENQGFYYLMKKLQQERLQSCIQSQAVAETMLDITVKYCKERIIFDKPLGSHQHNTFKIVDMATEIELGRTFVDDLVADFLEGKDIVKRVSMGKALLAEMANRVAYNCVQLHGGYGYMDEYPISRYYRDVRVYPIFAGSTETMKSIIGKMMGF